MRLRTLLAIERDAAALHARTGGDGPRGVKDERYTEAEYMGWALNYWHSWRRGTQLHLVPRTYGQWVGWLAREISNGPSHRPGYVECGADIAVETMDEVLEATYGLGGGPAVLELLRVRVEERANRMAKVAAEIAR